MSILEPRKYYCNPLIFQHNRSTRKDLKPNVMKMIDVLKEEMNKSLKEIKENTST